MLKNIIIAVLAAACVGLAVLAWSYASRFHYAEVCNNATGMAAARIVNSAIARTP